MDHRPQLTGQGVADGRDSRLGLGRVPSLIVFAAVGLVQTLCFDEVPSVWLHWVAWTPLVWLAILSRWSLRRSFFASWICGTVFWGVNVGWIAHTIGVHGGLGSALGLGLLLLLALYMGLYWSVFVVVGRLIFKRQVDSRSVMSPARMLWIGAGLGSVWILLEVVREWMFTGFPWSPLGEAMVRTTGALDASAWIGVRGLSFLVLMVNALIAWWLHAEVTGRLRSRNQLEAGVSGPSLGVARAVVAGSLALVALALALAGWGDREPPPQPTEASIPVRVVQPNVAINPPAETVVKNYQRLMELSQCGAEQELIVWPESAAFPYSWQRHVSLRRDVDRALDDRCELLFNTAWQTELPDRSVGFTNTALLATQPEDVSRPFELQRYDKNHLVPYGEYVPLKELLPFVGQLARSVGEFERGTEPTLLRWREAIIGVSICFEVLFPKEVAERSRLGATALMVLTNDAWFGDSRAPHQHLVSARFRAAETRRPLVFAAVTGTSALVDARGRVVDKLPLDTAGTLSGDLVADLGHRLDPKVTVYSAAPWVVELVALLLFAVSGLWATGQWRAETKRTET